MGTTPAMSAMAPATPGASKGTLLATGAMVGGTVLQAGGQIGAALFNQNISDYNAKVAQQQARFAIKRGSELERRQRVATRGMIGAQRAGFAGQNVEVDNGSALDVQRDTAALGAADALEIRNNAALEAWGYKVQGVNAQMQGRLDMMRGVTGATGTLLTGGAQTYATYRQLKSMQ